MRQAHRLAVAVRRQRSRRAGPQGSDASLRTRTLNTHRRHQCARAGKGVPQSRSHGSGQGPRHLHGSAARNGLHAVVPVHVQGIPRHDVGRDCARDACGEGGQCDHPVHGVAGGGQARNEGHPALQEQEEVGVRHLLQRSQAPPCGVRAGAGVTRQRRDVGWCVGPHHGPRGVHLGGDVPPGGGVPPSRGGKGLGRSI